MTQPFASAYVATQTCHSSITAQHSTAEHMHCHALNYASLVCTTTWQHSTRTFCFSIHCHTDLPFINHSAAQHSTAQHMHCHALNYASLVCTTTWQHSTTTFWFSIHCHTNLPFINHSTAQHMHCHALTYASHVCTTTWQCTIAALVLGFQQS